jgi:hypothetical protein
MLSTPRCSSPQISFSVRLPFDWPTGEDRSYQCGATWRSRGINVLPPCRKTSRGLALCPRRQRSAYALFWIFTIFSQISARVRIGRSAAGLAFVLCRSCCLCRGGTCRRPVAALNVAIPPARRSLSEGGRDLFPTLELSEIVRFRIDKGLKTFAVWKVGKASLLDQRPTASPTHAVTPPPRRASSCATRNLSRRVGTSCPDLLPHHLGGSILTAVRLVLMVCSLCAGIFAPFTSFRTSPADGNTACAGPLT